MITEFFKEELSAWCDKHHVDKGSEVIVSALDNNPAIQTCLDLDLIPILADVNVDTLQPTIKTLQAAKSAKTVAVIVKHYGGYPVSMDDVWAWCKVRRLGVMDDATQAFPTSYKKWCDGVWPSDITYTAPVSGYSYEHRKKIWASYTKAFEDIEGLELPWEDSKYVKQARLIYTIRSDNRIDANGLVRKIPIPRLGHWKSLPVFSDLVERGVILPLQISEEDAGKVIDYVKSYVL